LILMAAFTWRVPDTTFAASFDSQTNWRKGPLGITTLENNFIISLVDLRPCFNLPGIVGKQSIWAFTAYSG
jgi:hypothetical protein